MAEPTRHKDPVAKAFKRSLGEGYLRSPCSIVVYGNMAVISDHSGSKMFIDLICARMMSFKLSLVGSWTRRADRLITHYVCERAISGNARTPDAPLDETLRDLLPTLTEEFSAQATHHHEFFFFLKGDEQKLRKINSSIHEGPRISEFGLPPGVSTIIHSALATVEMKKPAEIRHALAFCGGSARLNGHRRKVFFDNMHIFDINREIYERWQTIPDPIHGFPPPRYSASPVVVDNKWLFVIGGSVRPRTDQRSVWRLDIGSSRWQRVFQLPKRVIVISAAHCRLSGRLFILMTDCQRNCVRMEMFRVAVSSLAWMSYSKVLSLLKPESLAAVHARFGFGVPGPSVNVAEATSRIMDILFAD